MSEPAGDEESEAIETASVEQLMRAVEKTRSYAFMIGAGTSRRAGIPTAEELTESWQEECYNDCMPDVEMDEWVEQQESEYMIDEQSRYGYWFERLHPTPGERRQRIQELVEDANTTPAHVILAALMSDGGDRNYVPVTLTPNFDDLLFDAFYLFLEDRPQLINHRAVAPEFKLTRDDPAIVKLHGDYLYDNLQNTDDETGSLEDSMETAVGQTVGEYGLVVIGYGGNDDSIMDALRAAEFSEYGVYWCVLEPDEGESVEDKLSEEAIELLRETESYVVPINGFLNLMLKFEQHINDVSLPERSELQNRADERRDRIEQMIAEAEAEDHPGDTDELLKLRQLAVDAFNSMEKGKGQKEVIEDLDEAISEGTEQTLGYRLRGILKLSVGDAEGAIEDFTRLIDLNPDDPDAYDNRGSARQQQGDHQGAIEDHKQAIKLDPEHMSAHYNIGNIKMTLGDYEQAVNYFTKAIDFGLESSDAYNERGKAKIELEKFEEAIKDYNRAIEIDPEYPNPYHNRGVTKVELGDYRGAIEDYNQAIELGPEHAGSYHNRASAKMELEDYEGAIEDYNKAIELDPEDPYSYSTRGNAKLNTEDYEGAVRDYNQAIDLGHKSSFVYNNRGQAKQKLGDIERAVSDYDKAVEKSPNQSIAYLNRSESRLLTDDLAKSRKDAKKASELSDTTAKRAESLLLYLISSSLTEENNKEEEQEYRDLCDQEFTTTWSFEVLDTWLENADLNSDKEDHIAELIDLLREHKPD